jgi:hypothetical protein
MGTHEAPISNAEMAGMLQQVLNIAFGRSSIADAPRGSSFELTAPATGQRFRLTIAEVPADEAVDAAIAAITLG